MSDTDLVKVLREEFSVSAEELDLAMRHAQRLQGPLHMVLWQFGLITLEQLDALLDRMISDTGLAPATTH
ncbi:DUF2949 domain-containing protein [Synechococcus sp. PCC 7336]|uniref:DUF2949 domain-containing protein n=1 Tax=Synechococcus sp. PCC 7336 TaxID=195250 RepID=UPI00034C8718|nr:DUF2949 domain-containing protein [Synechococcus sp. PCC 7336]